MFDLSFIVCYNATLSEKTTCVPHQFNIILNGHLYSESFREFADTNSKSNETQVYLHKKKMKKILRRYP